MKHTKIFFALLVLAAAVLAFGCKQANDSSSFTLSTAQQTVYDTQITLLATAAATGDISAAMVKTKLQTMNMAVASQGFKITDTKDGTDIKRGTEAKALKERFVPAKL